MRRKYPYYRITCHLYEGRYLSLDDCVDYVNHMGFLDKGVPVAVVCSEDKRMKKCYNYDVWIWGTEFCSASMNNSERIIGQIEIEWNGFGKLYQEWMLGR